MKVAPFNPRDRVDYNFAGNEIIVSTDFVFIQMSASGNSAGGYGGFANLLEAERAAWREARCRNAIFIPAMAAEGQP